MAKAIPRVPDLTLLLAAPLHVPTPGAMGPWGQQGTRCSEGIQEKQELLQPTAPRMKSPRWESRTTPTFPGEPDPSSAPEALARPWWPEGLSPEVWEAQDLQPSRRASLMSLPLRGSFKGQLGGLDPWPRPGPEGVNRTRSPTPPVRAGH